MEEVKGREGEEGEEGGGRSPSVTVSDITEGGQWTSWMSFPVQTGDWT